MLGDHSRAGSVTARTLGCVVRDGGISAFRALRRAKLARILRFYADKACRHYLTQDRYESFVTEIDRMIEKGEEYSFAAGDLVDRGWVFCPEFTGSAPLEITPAGWDVRIFLFGPRLLPDSDWPEY